MKLKLCRVGRVSPLRAAFERSTNGAHGVTRPASYAAFTMIEIAISLAIIGFALVAIIGVLPTGLTVQKDNREDTIINQDGPYLIEAIRNGAKGLDHLTNYVERIGVVLRDVNTNVTTLTTNFSQFEEIRQNRLQSGSNIVGLLSLPKWSLYAYGTPSPQYVVRVETQMRSLTGSAVEQGAANPDFAFSYLLVSEVLPFDSYQVPTSSTNYLFANGETPPSNVAEREALVKERKINWITVRSRERNTSEIRMTFRWPLLANGRTGPNRKSFRVLATGEKQFTNGFCIFQPQSFAVVPAP